MKPKAPPSCKAKPASIARAVIRLTVINRRARTIRVHALNVPTTRKVSYAKYAAPS